MSLFLAVLLQASVSVQTQEIPQQAGTASSGAALESSVDRQQAKPLAASRDDAVVSKNEAYNAARLADGRMGVRLGNDMSYRVTGN